MESHDPLIQSIIGCACTVAKKLGHGFTKEIYANALAIELRKGDLKVAQGTRLDVFYDGVCAGNSRADQIVEERVMVAVSIEDGVDAVGIAQCRNDLKAAYLVNGLMVRFGHSRIEATRVCAVSEESEEYCVTDVIAID